MKTKEISITHEELCSALRKAMKKAGFSDGSFLDLVINDEEYYQAAWADEGGYGVRSTNEALAERAANWIAKYLESRGLRYNTFSYAGGMRQSPKGYINAHKRPFEKIQTCTEKEVILYHYFVITNWMSIGD